jgi:predicted GNAT family acetyltransferase
MRQLVDVADHPERRRYELVVDGQRAGQITYSLRGDVITLIHTEVDPALQGRGLGVELARGALDDAQARGLKVIPRCPFIAAVIERHIDRYGDLIATHV